VVGRFTGESESEAYGNANMIQDNRLEQYAQILRTRNYSPRTQANYMRTVKTYRNFAARSAPGREPVAYIRDYIDWLKRIGRGAKGINLQLAAIRLYYATVVKAEIKIKDLPYLIEPAVLPRPFSVEEMGRIFATKMNPKHLLLLALYYNCGLRLSEVVGLKVFNIDRDRKTLYVRGKGSKDRFLSIREIPGYLLDLQCANKKPNDALIDSAETGGHICKRTAQKVFENVCRKAGVSQPWNIHRLRHTFACHLLDGGTNIKFIQGLMGHSSVRTTELYAKCSNEALSSVIGPLARVVVNGGMA